MAVTNNLSEPLEFIINGFLGHLDFILQMMCGGDYSVSCNTLKTACDNNAVSVQ